MWVPESWRKTPRSSAHTFHQAIELIFSIGSSDVAVVPGDVIVGDQEGASVIPLHLAEGILQEAIEMTDFE